MPNLTSSEPIFAGYPMERLNFQQANIAASQTAVALKVNANAAASGANDVIGYVAPWDGSIIAVSIVTDTNKTAGVLTVVPTKNGVALTTSNAPAGLIDVPLANASKTKVKAVDAQQARFVAGDLIGLMLTTDGSFLPVTADGQFCLYVVYENVQP